MLSAVGEGIWDWDCDWDEGIWDWDWDWDAIAARFCAAAARLHAAPPSDLRCLLSASVLENDFPHPAHACWTAMLECSVMCRLQSCFRAKLFPHPGHSHANGLSSVCERRCPRRLNRLVNVLPHPGTGQWNCASFRRRLALAACVAVVVTCCFSTCMIGGRRMPDPSSGPSGLISISDPPPPSGSVLWVCAEEPSSSSSAPLPEPKCGEVGDWDWERERAWAAAASAIAAASIAAALPPLRPLTLELLPLASRILGWGLARGGEAGSSFIASRLRLAPVGTASPVPVPLVTVPLGGEPFPFIWAG